jgi:hypothetical protein
MPGHRLPIRARAPRMARAVTMVLMMAIGPSGCHSDPPSPPVAERAEVYCDSCRKKVARQDTETRIGLEGTDVYICRACVAAAAQGKAATAPPVRVRSKSSSRGRS